MLEIMAAQRITEGPPQLGYTIELGYRVGDGRRIWLAELSRFSIFKLFFGSISCCQNGYSQQPRF